MVELGKVEDEIFRERKSRELRFRAMDKARKRSRQLETDNAPAFMTRGQFAPNVSKIISKSLETKAFV
jgi:hypothetical protein